MFSRFLLLLWVPVVMLACLAFTSERADAEEALASWYGPGFSGLPTASGEPYDPYGFTAAHKTMPLGTELLVSYGGSSVAVTVNDRGPYVGERELDLSQGAAETLGLTEAGVDYVDYTWTDPYAAPPQDAWTNQYASASQESYSSVSTPQYSAENEAVFSDQYAIVEQYPQIEAAAEPQAASAAPAASPSSAVAGDVSGSILVVSPGETLSSLAAETGVSEDYLACRNAIGDPNFIYAGQVIYY